MSYCTARAGEDQLFRRLRLPLQQSRQPHTIALHLSLILILSTHEHESYMARGRVYQPLCPIWKRETFAFLLNQGFFLVPFVARLGFVKSNESKPFHPGLQRGKFCGADPISTDALHPLAAWRCHGGKHSNNKRAAGPVAAATSFAASPSRGVRNAGRGYEGRCGSCGEAPIQSRPV